MYEEIDTYSCDKCAAKLRGNGAELSAKEWDALEFRGECDVCGKAFDTRSSCFYRRCGECALWLAAEIVVDLALVTCSMFLIVQNGARLQAGGLDGDDEEKLKWGICWVSAQTIPINL